VAQSREANQQIKENAMDEDTTHTKNQLKHVLVLTLGLLLALLTARPAGAIVGGNPTTPDQYPYFVRVGIRKFEDRQKSTHCGGSVIAPGWILTAAHCFTDDQERPILPSEDIDVNVPFQDQSPYPAIEAVLHPLWDGQRHDLALVRIDRYATDPNPASGIPQATKVQVGAPADPGAYAVGVIATIVGYGATHEGGSSTYPELRDLHTPLHSDAYMDDIYNSWFGFDHWQDALMIGAGWTNHSVCNGDSGGPLTVNRNGVTVQVGVVSFTTQHWYNDVETCDEPGGYAELSGPQLAWIGATVPDVAARWGLCWIDAARIGLATPGRLEATYVYIGAAASQFCTKVGSLTICVPRPYTDGPYQWNFSCVPSEPIVLGEELL
jgi:hypothetical protein